MWAYAPVLVLEKIYAMLSLADRYACSRVCRHWLDVFRSARLWKHLKIGRRTFTRRKLRTAYLRAFQHGGNDEFEINHWRFQMYLGVFGHHCRRLTFQPIEHFYNLFEFLRASTHLFVHPSSETLQSFRTCMRDTFVHPLAHCDCRVCLFAPYKYFYLLTYLLTHRDFSSFAEVCQPFHNMNHSVAVYE